MAKTLLWQKGGRRLYVCGPEAVYRQIAAAYAPGGARAFDARFMAEVYGAPFEVVHRAYEDRPAPHENPRKIGRHIDGKVVFSESVVWYPEKNADPGYHLAGISASLRSAARHLPRVDAVGVSSSGVFSDNRTAAASIFRLVPKKDFDSKVRNIYLRAVAELGGPPVAVCNDGDVTALAGSMFYDRNSLLSLDIGAGVAAGYVDASGGVTGWLSELGLAPADLNPGAARDEWSGDVGCGSACFSRGAALELAAKARLTPKGETPEERFADLQSAAVTFDDRALAVFSDVGCMLGHTLPFYHALYGMKTVLLSGPAMTGAAGEMVALAARRVLREEYPEAQPELLTPDDAFRRTVTDLAAASLPPLKGE
jgi:hypothetical protein